MVAAAMFEHANWEAYGGRWIKQKSQEGKRTKGKCESCQGDCGHDFWSFGDDTPAEEEWVEYTVSDGSRAMLQGILDASTAQLIAQAPALWRFVAEFVKESPMDEYESCIWCGAARDAFPGQEPYVPHERNCLYRKAMTVMANCEKEVVIPRIVSSTYSAWRDSVGLKPPWTHENEWYRSEPWKTVRGYPS
jgi:hypothetical protein